MTSPDTQSTKNCRFPISWVPCRSNYIFATSPPLPPVFLPGFPTMSSSNPSASEPAPPAKVPRVDGPAPPPTPDLLTAIQALGAQLSTLTLKVETLERSATSGHGGIQPAPVVYPQNVTATALTQLAADPSTPAPFIPFLTTLAALFPNVLDEHHQGLIQQCYNHALQFRQPGGPTVPVPPIPLPTAIGQPLPNPIQFAARPQPLACPRAPFPQVPFSTFGGT